MKIFYGHPPFITEVTSICLSRLTQNNIMFIPDTNKMREAVFPHHSIANKKYVYVEHEGVIRNYDETTAIYIDLINNTIHTNEIHTKLSELHTKLILKHGSFQEELSEQRLSVKYLKGHEKVLEIGGNIGRNSLVIASLIDSTQLVVLESDPGIASQLIENRELNGLHFHVEPSALSKRSLIQNGWDTVPSDIGVYGFSKVTTITWDELKTKYPIEFDTLVLDCEGAFYYIVMDMPEILANMKLILMENDYHNISHKNYVDDALKRNGFVRDYSEKGGWGPCENNFFEVWKK